jgi:hypothetical protein
MNRTLILLSFLFFLSSPLVQAKDVDVEDPNCVKTCLEENCSNPLTIKYGKYCGVEHTGCKDEKPCDHIDGCCAVHDKCMVTVSKKGKANAGQGCHKKFLWCMSRVQKMREIGFSTKCPLQTVVPTLRDAIQSRIKPSPRPKEVKHDKNWNKIEL